MEKRNYLVTFMQAYLLCIGPLNQLMGILLDREDGIMIMNLIPIAVLMVLHFFISDKKNDLNLDKKALLFVYYMASILIVYKYVSTGTTFSKEEMLVYFMIPIYLSFYKVDVKRLLEFIMLISVCVIPVSEKFFEDMGYSSYETIGMSTTYNILPFVVAAILHFFYYRKSAGLITWVGYAVNAYYLTKAVLYGNRGPMISLLVLAILLYLHKFDNDGIMKKNTGKVVFATLTIGTVAIAAISNLNDIILWLHSWLQSMDIEIAAVSKSVATIGQGDLSNGREEINRFVFQGIKENFLLGNGISSIAYKSYGRIPYPHNLFLQMWYDLGVFVSIPLLIITIKTIIKTVFKPKISKQYATILILLATLSIPRLCFSIEFWTDISFWFLLMYSISPNIYEEKTKTSYRESETETNIT